MEVKEFTVFPKSLLPTQAERVNRVRGDIAMGMPCLIKNRETTFLVVSLETISEHRFLELHNILGTPELVITANRARAVMSGFAAVSLADDPVIVLPPESASFDWYSCIVDPQHPGGNNLEGPLHVLRSEEDVAHRAALRLVKSAELLPAVALFTVPYAAETLGLPYATVSATEALEELVRQPTYIQVAKTFLPIEAHEVIDLQVFRDPDGIREHYAILIGKPQLDKPVLTRLHSACFTGDVLGSLKCDCGPQLRAALAKMGEEDSGLLLYLNQEGRGIGLANKMRVYDLQSKGLDTVEANHHLGYQDDERDFRTASALLHQIGITSVRLLTNNPKKVGTLEEQGITVAERLPLRVGLNMHNQNYLSIKASKSGHLI